MKRPSFTISQLDHLRATGKIRGYNVIGVKDEQPKKGSKYRNKKIVFEGETYDSIKELEVYQKYKLLQRAGAIKDLQRQVVFKLEHEGKKICKYIADFTYYEKGIYHVCDVKSDMTRKLPTYRLKKKLMKTILNIEIREL